MESNKPAAFIDADVLYAGSFSAQEHGASAVTLRMSEITLIDAITSEQVIAEVERNLTAKAPRAISTFRFLVDRCLRVVSNPSLEAVEMHRRLAEPKDLPILVAALHAGCPFLLTFNGKDYQPGHPSVEVLRPGDFLSRVRGRLSSL